MYKKFIIAFKKGGLILFTFDDIRYKINISILTYFIAKSNIQATGGLGFSFTRVKSETNVVSSEINMTQFNDDRNIINCNTKEF